MELVEFNPSHLYGFHGREGDGPVEISIGLELMSHYRGVGWTVLDNGHVIGAAGMVLWRPGVGYPWAIFQNGIEAKRLWITRETRRRLAEAIKRLSVDSVEVHIEQRSIRNRLWAESMGFRIHDPIETHRDHRGCVYVRYDLEGELCRG